MCMHLAFRYRRLSIVLVPARTKDIDDERTNAMLEHSVTLLAGFASLFVGLLRAKYVEDRSLSD